MAEPSPFLAQANALAAELVDLLLRPGADPSAIAADLLAVIPPDPALFVASLVQAHPAAATLPNALFLHRFVAALRRAVFGPAHPSVAAVLQHMAQGHRLMDELQEAAALLQEAVAICEAAPGQPGLAACLADLGAVLAALAGENAEPVLLRALDQLDVEQSSAIDVAAILEVQRDLAHLRGHDEEAWNRALAAVAAVTQGYGPAVPKTAIAMLAAARIGAPPDHRDEAAALARAAADIIDAPQSADHPDFWAALLARGRSQMDLGHLESARQCIAAADRVVVQRLGKTHPLHLETLEALGDWSLRFSAPSVARVFHNMCLSVRRVEAGPPRLRIAALLAKLADGFMREGDTVRAQVHLTEALALRREVLGMDHPILAETHLALGSLALQTGHYATAQAHLDEGLSLQRQCGATRAVTAAISGAKARLLSDIGDHKAALRLQQETVVRLLGMHGPGHPAAVEGLNILAAIVLRWGGRASASKLIGQVLAARYKMCGVSDGAPQIALAATLRDAGALAAIAGDHARSAWHFAASADLTERIFARAHPDLAAARLGQAAAALARGAPEAARDLAASGLSRGTALLPAEDEWRLFAMLADAYAAQGLMSAAIFFGKRAVNRLQRVRTALQPLERTLQAHFLGGRAKAYWTAAERLIAAGRLAEAQQVVGMLKAAELREGLRGGGTRWGDLPAPGRGSTLTATEAAWQATMDGLIAVINEMNQAASQVGDGIPALPEHQAELAVLGRRRQAAEQAWFAWVRTGVAEAPAAQTATAGGDEAGLARLRGQLRAQGPGTAALDYLVLRDHVEIIVTTLSEQTTIRVAVTEATLNETIFQFWSRLRRRAPDVLDPARALYRLLFAPVEPVLAAAGIKLLLLSSAGALRYIPFSALYDSERPLGDVYATAFRATATAASHGPRRNTGPSALFGTTRSAGKLAALAHAAQEIEAVAASLPGATIRMNDAFTAAALQEALAARPAVVHLATHFTLLPAREAESWLLLGDGGALTAAELLDGRFALDGVELLSLSACETAMATGVPRPEAASGREVESLPAALLAAGVGAVLASLWPVDDASTAALMRQFYHLWRVQGVPAPEALRRAQGHVARAQPEAGSGKPQWHPHQWAAFVLFVPG